MESQLERTTEVDNEKRDFDLTKYTKEEISDAIDEAVGRFANIPEIDVSRMKGQIEWVRKVMYAYQEGYKTVIIDAPTGFGKSIMAFLLANTYKILGGHSYIMTSNKYLQNQYDDDIKTFKFDDIVMIKGQDNYTCTENNQPISKRACADYSLKKVEDGASPFDCAKDCFFIQQRLKARTYPTTVLNYSYWLTTMNKVYEKLGEYAPFQPRKLSIFDECHVMGDIVQDSFTTEINIVSLVRRTSTYMIILKERLKYPPTTTYHEFDAYKPLYEAIIKCGDLNGQYPAQHKLIDEICMHIENIKREFFDLVKAFTKVCPKDKGGNILIPKEDQVIVGHFKVLVQLSDELSELHAFYTRVGLDTMVVYLEQVTDMKQRAIPQLGSRTMSTLKLKCTNESELVSNKVHKFSEYSLFMSATVGNIAHWASQVGIPDGTWKGFVVPQIFTYEKSPIRKVSPMISMAHRDKGTNLPKMLRRIQEIIDNHPNERGLIHTGNYELTKEIERLGHPRIITYTSASGKDDAISKYIGSKDAVICAPSLVEGVDFKDDLCRFMAFAKVPYLSLGDQLTKRKMEVYENWYGWVTASNIMQGLGRPIRNKTDWCTTYLLDASFDSFLKRYPLPQWIMDRIEIVKEDNLNEKFNPDAEFDDMLGDLFG